MTSNNPSEGQTLISPVKWSLGFKLILAYIETEGERERLNKEEANR